MKGSANRAEAEIKANRVSAKPGHSEHQLGTTVDLKCNGCGDFDNSSGNLAMYKFLEENAYKFGFAISYANGTEQYTGYKNEPWHIRYLGESLANEFNNTGYLKQNGNYLAKFLLQK
jgi:D-alanyl-D-alanine carboxypeptidase